MSTDLATISYLGRSHLSLSFGELRLAIDPSLPRARRGRAEEPAAAAAPAYVLLTRPSAVEDALDVLESAPDAVLVAAAEPCRVARRELRLPADQVLDLEPWERASEEALKLTAVPCALPSPMDDGFTLLEDLSGRAFDAAGSVRNAGRGALGGFDRGGFGSFERLARSFEELPIARSAVRNLQTLSSLRQGLLGLGGRLALGYLLQPVAGPSVLHLADGVHDGADERELEDIVTLASKDGGSLDIVIAELGGSVAALVRAVRVLAPKTVLVYRSQDPFARGRRAVAGPSVAEYLGALDEDQGDRLEAVHLRTGDRYVVPAATGAA